jgi:glycerate dehydrogenase
MKIVVLDGYTLNPGDNPWDEVARLGDLQVFDRSAAHEIVPRGADADIVLTNKTPISAATMGQWPQLKFIAVLATGYNVVDIQAAGQRKIPVSNVPIYGTDTVAQHVFACLLSVVHRPLEHDQAIRQGRWAAAGDFCFWLSPISELAGKTMGIVGFGRIGRRVAEVAHAFGMRVVAQDVQQSAPPSYSEFRWMDLGGVFAESDVVSLHCPQTADNAGFVNRALLKRMKPTAILINAARGGLIQEADLAEALNAGTIAAACLDVVSVEPIRDDNPLLRAKNCLITPHIAWASLEARRRLMRTTAENIANFMKGTPANVVNRW